MKKKKGWGSLDGFIAYEIKDKDGYPWVVVEDPDEEDAIIWRLKDKDFISKMPRISTQSP